MAELTLSFFVYEETPKNETIELAKSEQKKSEKIVPFATNTTLWEADEYKMWRDLMPAIESIVQGFPDIIIAEHTLDLAEAQEKPHIFILFVKSNDLTSHSKLLDDLAQSKWRDTVKPEDKEKEKPDFLYHPIITIGYPDITYLDSEDKDDQKQKDWNNMLMDSLELDKRFKFLDSSIWHRYVPVVPCDATFEEVLGEVLKDIYGYHQKRLYDTSAAVISLEFQMRMLLHSYVAKFGTGGHSEVVAPFKFHSERQMHKKANQEIEFLHQDWGGGTLLKALQWRTLLVDDQAAKLSFIEKDETLIKVKVGSYAMEPGKKMLIEEPLKKLYPEAEREIPFKIAAPPSEHLIMKFAKEQISNNTYDIIFLDYLLGDDDKNKREYGHHFLLELLKNNRQDEFEDEDSKMYRRDLSGKYWIFPISSYPYALFDKLTQLGISHLQEIWHIAQGGDPLSTPHLYTYNLFRFMKQRISDYFLHPTALRDLLNQVPLTDENIENRLWTEITLQSIENWEKKLKLLDKIHFDINSKGFVWSIRRFIKAQKREYLNDTLNKIKNILTLLDGVESMKDEEEVNEYLHILGIIDLKNGEKVIEYPVDDPENKKILSYPDVLKLFGTKVDKILHHNFDKAKKEIEAACKTKKSYLSLANLGIYKIPAEIKWLQDLEQLNLEGNYLAELPDELKDLKKLTSIDLRKNRFAQFPDILFKLEYLEYINLSSNQLYKMPKYRPKELQHLEYLNLHNNFLKFTKTEVEVKKLWEETVLNSNRTQIKTELYGLIAKDELRQTITSLENYDKDGTWANDLAYLRGRYTTNKNNLDGGIINYESYSLQLNSIRNAILSFVENVKE